MHRCVTTTGDWPRDHDGEVDIATTFTCVVLSLPFLVPFVIALWLYGLAALVWRVCRSIRFART